MIDDNEYNKIKLHRLLFFSDAVTAIIITLLVIELHLPHLVNSKSASEMLENLINMAPNFGAFLLCFLTLGQGWIGQNALFSLVIKYDNSIAILILMFLLPSCLLPFAATLIGEYFNNPMSFIFLASISFFSSIMSYFINRRLIKRKMFSPSVDISHLEKLTKNMLLFPFASILMGFLAYYSTFLSFSLFMCSMLISLWNLRNLKLIK
jgi:uncharacterized membrane protein